MPAPESESAVAWLFERFPAGLEERPLGDVTELAVFTDEAGETLVRTAFADVTSEAIARGWEDGWKQFHRPVRAGGLWIGQPWAQAPSNEPAVIVDPGRAFGTGTHPTTRACIELLSRLERGSLLDAGCGSGVVSVAAARLGFAPVLAVDLDEVAVEVASQTARANGVDLRVWRMDVLADEIPATELVVANIELSVVETLLQRVPARIAVTSGYSARDAPSDEGWTAVERLELEGWAADVLVRRH